MSRGPGRWQRLLLDALENDDVVVVNHVVNDACVGMQTRSEQVAARRAAKTLAEAGHAHAIYLLGCRSCGTAYDTPATRCCGPVTHVLALTTDGSRRSALLPLKAPACVNVASEAKGTSGNT